jgi:hypothetical protein
MWGELVDIPTLLMCMGWQNQPLRTLFVDISGSLS